MNNACDVSIAHHASREKKRLFIIAGEASGDMLAAEVMAALRAQMGEAIEIAGIGGEAMQRQGLHSLFPISDIALMGFAEILPHSWRLLNRLSETCQAIAAFHPDIILTIDSPGFNKRVVQWVRRAYGKRIPCVHYVAPTVWAYKPERAATVAKLYDQLLTILPFEAPYFEAYQLPTTFVGHPLAQGLSYTPPLPCIWQEGEPLRLVLFPGSRAGEVARLLPLFQQTCTLLRHYFPHMQVSIVVNELSRPHVQVDAWAHPPQIISDKAVVAETLAEAHVALTKTGTVTLEIAKAGVPMVACYQVHPFTARVMRRLLRIPYVNLLNIMARRMVIPELLQEACTPHSLCATVSALVKNPQAAQAQVQANWHSLQQLSHPSGQAASALVTEKLMELL